MVKKENEADDFEEPFRLKWQWRTEPIEHIKENQKGIKGSLKTVEQLLDQKAFNDTSDYLWYCTRYNVIFRFLCKLLFILFLNNP